MARTKGATSNVIVTLAQLTARFRPDAEIPVSRSFANENGLIGRALAATAKNINSLGNPIQLEEKVALQEVVEEEETPIALNEVQETNDENQG